MKRIALFLLLCGAPIVPSALELAPDTDFTCDITAGQCIVKLEALRELIHAKGQRPCAERLS